MFRQYCLLQSATLKKAVLPKRRCILYRHLVQGYAPTNDAEPEKKAEFCDTLQSIIDKTRKKDLVIIMGDFNAKLAATVQEERG